MNWLNAQARANGEAAEQARLRKQKEMETARTALMHQANRNERHMIIAAVVAAWILGVCTGMLL